MGVFARKLQLSALLTFLSLSAFGVELEPKTVRDFSPGLHTKQDSSVIPDGAAQDLSNVDVYTGRLEKRRGTLAVNSTALTGNQAVRLGHEYIASNGTFYLLTVSSNTIFYSSDGGATNTVGTSTHGITATTRFHPVNAFGNAYFISSTTNAIVFNGSSFTQNTSIPLGSAAAFFAGRLWVANGSTLYGSRVSDDTDWTDDGVDDADAFSAVVRSQDGYSITALVPFGPDLLVFKSYSVDRLVINSDGLTFSLVPVISHIGTNYPEAVQTEDNAVVWLAHDGVYAYNGAEIKRISENIQPSVESLAQLSAASRSYNETYQADFAVGTSTGVTPYITDGSVVLSTWTAVDTSTTDFNAGSLTNLTALNGNLYLSSSTTGGFDNPGAESGSGSTPDYWRQWNGFGITRSTKYARSGSYAFDIAATLASPAITYGLDIGGTETSYFSLGNSPGTSYAQVSFSSATLAGRMVNFFIAGTGFSGSIKSGSFLYNGGTITFYAKKTVHTSSVTISIDDIAGTGIAIGSGTIISQTFDTRLQTPVWASSTPTFTANVNSFAFYTQASADGSSWDAPVSWSTGSAPNSASKRYIRYQITITTGTDGTAQPFISDVTLNAKQKSGRYLSQAVATTGGSTFLPFAANGSTNGGSLTFEVYTDTDSNITIQNGVPLASSFTSSQTVTSGNTPTLSIGNYARVGSTFSITAATQNPQLDDFTLAWGEGNATLYPASLFWDQHYYLSLAVNSATQNDTIFIYDRNGAWTKYEGLPAFSMFKYRTNPYFGAADSGTIVRMQVTDRYRDYLNNATTATWTSKDFDFGFPLTSKTLVRYYLTGRYDPTGNVTFSYGVNRGNLTSNTYALDLTSGFFYKAFSPTSLTYSEGIQHRYKLYDATLDGPMSILSVTGKYNLGTNP